jgi:long-chain-fatty-acid--CoA ligase ACSBG
MWRRTLANYGHLGALTFEVAANQWRTITYRQYYDLAISFAKSLIALGVPEFTAVNIIGFNSVEWAVAFYGSIFGHYLPIGLYTTNGPDTCAYIANHSEAQIVFMEDASHLKKYIQVSEQVKAVKHYVIWKGAVPTDLPAEFKGKVMTWKEFMAFGEKKY